tara:strand:- start:3012 stop:3287 length:276 start_codon:yes stop_codon:yes gene_type:complete
MNPDRIDLVRSVCEEFCDCIIIDDSNGSFLIYVPKKWYQPLCSRLAQLDVVEVFRNKRKQKIVVLFQILCSMPEEDIFYEDDDDMDFDDIF